MKKQIFKLQSLIMLLLLMSGGFLYAAAFNYDDKESEMERFLVEVESLPSRDDRVHFNEQLPMLFASVADDSIFSALQEIRVKWLHKHGSDETNPEVHESAAKSQGSCPINLREQLPKGPITQEIAREIYYSFPEFHGLPVQELNEHLQKVVSESGKNMRKSAAVALIEAGADIECESLSGMRILAKAIDVDDVPLVDYLLSKGAIGDYLYYGDPIFWRSESLKMLMLFKKFDFGKTNEAGNSIVHYIIAMRRDVAHDEKRRDVAHDENYAMLKSILRNCSFLVNHVDSWGYTPLCKIALHGSDNNHKLKIAQLLIDHGAKRSYRITRDHYSGCTAAQVLPESNVSRFISSPYASTLYETIVRVLLEGERSADKATADQAKDDLATALLLTQAPDAFSATLNELRGRLKNTSDEVEQQQLAHDIKSLEFLAVTRYEGRQPLAELIAEYREEHRALVPISQPAPVGEGAQWVFDFLESLD